MEVQGSACDKVDIDWKEILELNEIKDMVSLKNLEKSIKPQKWKEIEDYLVEHLTDEQAQRTMKMLGALRQGASEADQLNARVGFLRHNYLSCTFYNIFDFQIIFQKISGESMLKYLKSDCTSDVAEKSEDMH